MKYYLIKSLLYQIECYWSKVTNSFVGLSKATYFKSYEEAEKVCISKSIFEERPCTIIEVFDTTLKP